MSMTFAELKRIAEWALSNDTGSSSKYLAACAIGTDKVHPIGRPYDADDFGRIYRFSILLDPTNLGNALRTAAWSSKGWKIIYDNWAELVDLFEASFVKNTLERSAFIKRFAELGL